MEEKRKKLLNTIFMILLIVGIGTFAVNQVLTYIYKAEFLKAPCQLCRDLNPDVDVCLTQAGTVQQFWNGSGWG